MDAYISRQAAETLKYAVSARAVQALIVSEFAKTKSDEVEDAMVRLYKRLKALQRDEWEENVSTIVVEAEGD